MDTVELGWSTAWLLPLLVLAAVALSRLAGTGQGRAVATASARAAVQLGIVGLIVAAALESGVLATLMVALMATVATLTCARRLGTVRSMGLAAGTAIAVPTAAVLGVLLLSAALPAQPVAVLPTGGILVGGAMTAATLAGRRLLADLQSRWGEFEAALALGFEAHVAARETVGRRAASEALVPVLDQTRTVGLVTLPGTFVGMVLGGASATQAALLQLLVLVCLLVVETAAAVIAAELAGRVALRGRGVV